jgi:hypothetical protein
MNRMKSHKYLSAARALAACVLALGAGATWGTAARAQGGVVGMVIAIKGAPLLKQSGAKLRLGARLSNGQVVRCAPGSEATVVVFGSGQRFRIAPGSEASISPQMKGAVPLKAPDGVSREVALALAGSRTGAVNMRGVADEAANARNFGAFTTLDASSDYGPGSHPEAGFLTEGSRALAWPSDLPINVDTGTTPAASGYVLWTLFDSSSNVIYHTRLQPQTGGQVRAEIPVDIELSTRRPYTWRAVSYAPNDSGRMRALPARWGLVTWLAPTDAKGLGTLLPSADKTPAKLARAEPERALLLASLLHQRGVDGGAWSLLAALRKAEVSGADGAFFDFYGGLPSISQLFGAQIASYMHWKAQQ